MHRAFQVAPVVKNPPTDARDIEIMGSIPGFERVSAKMKECQKQNYVTDCFNRLHTFPIVCVSV